MKRRHRSTSTIALLLRLLVLLLVTVYSQSPGEIVIPEIAWMGTSTSSNDEWIELDKNILSPITLAGWRMHESNRQFCLPNDRIPYLVVEYRS